MVTVATSLIKYWPAIVAGLFLAYNLAAGNSAAVPGAFAGFLAALGLNTSIASAHAKIDRI